jgi:hypothetical protein
MEFSTVHSALASFMQVFDDRFQAESGCSILTLLGIFIIDASASLFKKLFTRLFCKIWTTIYASNFYGRY